MGATATMKASSTNSPASMESAALKSTAAGASEASRSAGRPRPRLKAASHRSRSTVNPARVILARDVMGSGPPAMHVRAEVMIIVPPVAVASVAVSIKRRAIHIPRRVKSPAEGAIENSISRNESESVEPWVPIPTRARPARSPRTKSVRRIHFRFCHITRSQTAPAIQIAFLVRFLVELLRFELAARRKVQLASSLYLRLPVAVLHDGLPVIDAHPSCIRVEVIQSSLQNSRRRSVYGNANIILRMYLLDFHHRLASFDSNLRVRKARRNHRHRAVVTNSQKHAGRQQNFRLPASRRQ